MNWLKQIASKYQTSTSQPNVRQQAGAANAAYTARLRALAEYYRQRSTATAPYRTATQFSRLPPGSPIAMSLDEYMRRVNARRMYGMPVFAPTQQEWILRQNAAPPGYVWTPYAGWVLASTFARQSGANLQTAQPTTTQTSVFDSGGGGGTGGGAAPASLPSWIEHFLNQVTWRI